MVDAIEPIHGEFFLKDLPEKRWFGSLSLGKTAELKITVLSAAAPFEMIPAMNGERVTLVGHCGDKYVTCFDSLQFQNVSSRSREGGITTISFRPSVVWSGPRAMEKSDTVHFLSLRFAGLHGVIGTKVIDEKYLSNEEKASLREVIGNASNLLIPQQSEISHQLEFRGCPINVSFYSSFNKSFGWQDGHSFTTSDHCLIECAAGMQLPDMMALKNKLNQFLSFVCLKSVSCNRISINVISPDHKLQKFELIYKIDEEKTDEAPMYHECLGTFRFKSDDMGRALKRWLLSSHKEELAMWLYLRCQDADMITVERFITICQAIEIVGRKHRPQQLWNKNNFKKAALMAAKIMTKELGADSDDEQSKRFADLIMNFNRPSFRDIVESFCNQIPRGIGEVFLPTPSKYLSDLVEMRNAFVHMQMNEDNIDSLQKKLSCGIYQSLALFAAYYGLALGLDEKEILSGLSNSSVGRSAIHLIGKGKIERSLPTPPRDTS